MGKTTQTLVLRFRIRCNARSKKGEEEVVTLDLHTGPTRQCR
jgi:hypothetical protein